MPFPNLSAFDALLAQTCAAVLGDEIQYRVDGAAEFITLHAHGNYEDQISAFEGSAAIEQDIRLEIPKVNLPIKPNGKARVTLPRVPGRLFRPINVHTDKSGEHWVFELKDVPNE